ncbi:disease resistance protein RGA5 isoform X1 [Lolium perenne]|uniref:disease resistance protein RGA5 isoform X1 n=2 Tax=Lolium perenne TaxID=4522 RepID=UPI003A9983BA
MMGGKTEQRNKEMDAPISASQGAMRSLPGKLDSLISGHKHNLRPEEKNKLCILQGDLQGLIDNYLLEPSEVEFPASTASFWMKDVRDLSYDIDDFLHELAQAGTSGSRISVQTQKLPRIKISRIPDKLKKRKWIADEILGFRSRVKEAIQRHISYLGDCKWRPSSSSGQLGEWKNPSTPCSIRLVGVESSIKQLCGRLANEGQPEHKVVSIVGTGGVGKTTLAKEVYRKLGGQFECRAFVQTSRKPDMKGLLTSILSQVWRHQLPDSCEVHKVVLKINQHLQDKTYIIVIDGLWASSTWDIINYALPKGNYCSRILTTTEVDAIAQTCYADTSKYMSSKKEGNSKYIFKKEPLNEDESRELLLSTVFGLQAECPQGLKEVSNEIIKRSGGLPLAINILASLLARQPASSLEHWNYIKNSLSSCLAANNSLEVINQVLNVGYDNLPHGLKACMLYLCMYEEDRVILKVDLVKQWMAEGFICAVEGDDVKEVARRYFDELVRRGMIQPVDVNCNDEILSCKVHHIILRFIRYKSIEENFILAVDHSQTSIRLADKVRRLALHFGNVEDATPPALASMQLSKVRSLAFSGLLKCMPSIVEFRFLQVLVLKLWADRDNRSDILIGSDDLSGSITNPDDLTDNPTEPDDVSYSLTEISELFRLRYFRLDARHLSVELPTQMQRLKDLVAWEIDAEVTSVPSDIVDLPGLFYLSIPSEVHLPSSIDRMTSLRTLGIIDLGKNITEDFMSLGELTNLQDLRLTCSMLQPDNLEKNLECLGSLIRKLSNLNCLTLVPAVSSHMNIQNHDGASIMSISWHGFTIERHSPAHLQRLELSWRCCFFFRLPEWTNELTKLCVLKIALRKMSSEDFAILKALPSLTALSLFLLISPARRIMFDSEGFLVLKYFKFVCAAPCLAFLDGAMPKLQNLKLGFNASRMKQYSLISAGFESLTGLNEISTKIGGAGVDECDRRSVQSVLIDTVSKHPSTPIMNVQWVDWNFCGDEEKYVENQKEIWKQTPEKQGLTAGESSDEYGIQGKNLEEDAKKQSDIRTCAILESTSYLQNTVHNVLEEYEHESRKGAGPAEGNLGDGKDASSVEEAMWVVEQWDLPATRDRLVFESPENAKEYLTAVACLTSVAGAGVEAWLQIAMARLEEEFRQLLIRGTTSPTAENLHTSAFPGFSPTISTFSSTSSIDNFGELDEPVGWDTWSSVSDGEISSYFISPETISTFKDIADVMHSLPYLIFPYIVSMLKDIADVMLHAGHALKLCQVYGEVRQEKLIECLTVLGVDKRSLEEVQRMEWVTLKDKKYKWIRALKVVVQGLLAEERRFCSQIFTADADIKEVCFTKAGKSCVLQLLSFANNIAVGKRSAEKLFSTLDMYEALAELLPELVVLFSGEARDFIKEVAEPTLESLGDTVLDTLAELANAIRGHTDCRSLPDGGIHQLTRYVMIYLVRLVADYSRWLHHLLDGHETDQLENTGMTPLGHMMMMLITHLWDKIEDKSELYDDEALQNIFLMNNLYYIMQKVNDSELKSLLGNNLICIRPGQLTVYSERYFQSSWIRAITCLTDDGLPHTTGSLSAIKGALQERFKSFNLIYEEICRTQTTWSVVDPQLREELRISITKKLIPAYRLFVERYRGQLGSRNFGKYVKYSPQDLEEQMLDLFEG